MEFGYHFVGFSVATLGMLVVMIRFQHSLIGSQNS